MKNVLCAKEDHYKITNESLTTRIRSYRTAPKQIGNPAVDMLTITSSLMWNQGMRLHPIIPKAHKPTGT